MVQLLVQSAAPGRASPELAALIASVSLSDLAHNFLGGGSSAAASSDATSAYLASLGSSGLGPDGADGAAAGAFKRAAPLAAQQQQQQQQASSPTGAKTAVVKTDQQAAMQSAAKEAALSKDKAKASQEVSAHPLSASPRPPILLIHGGAQARIPLRLHPIKNWPLLPGKHPLYWERLRQHMYICMRARQTHALPEGSAGGHAEGFTGGGLTSSVSAVRRPGRLGVEPAATGAGRAGRRGGHAARCGLRGVRAHAALP